MRPTELWSKLTWSIGTRYTNERFIFTYCGNYKSVECRRTKDGSVVILARVQLLALPYMLLCISLSNYMAKINAD